MSWQPFEEWHTYRVALYPDTGVHVEYLGDYDPSYLDEYYDTVYALPTWAQNKLATLYTIEFTPPIEPVFGVGRRVGKYVYWLFVTEEERHDGNNP